MVNGAELAGGLGGFTFGVFLSLWLQEVMPADPMYPTMLHFVWAAVLGMFGYAYARRFSRTRRVR